MEWSSILAALLGGSVAATIIALYANRRNTSADTYSKLANTVSSLTEDLGSERAARRQDKQYFQESLDRVVMDYERKLKALEFRVAELEKERAALLLDNHRLKKELEEKSAERGEGE